MRGGKVKYLVIGAGGTGAPLAAFMAHSGKDVTLIARGETLCNIEKNGLTVEKSDGQALNVKIKVSSAEEYNDTPDVIFLCVKSYSVNELLGFISRIIGKSTVIIPLLNIYTTGKYLSKKFPENLVTDGCIYIAANIGSPGVIKMHGNIFRVVFGERNAGKKNLSVLKQVENDLKDSAISGILSDNIEKDALKKFSYVSPAAACGLYYDCMADKMQREGRERELFCALIREITDLASAMGIIFEDDMVKVNLSILDKLEPTAGTSMQLDIARGKRSEINGLIHEVVRQAEKFGLELENYKMISQEFSYMN